MKPYLFAFIFAFLIGCYLIGPTPLTQEDRAYMLMRIVDLNHDEKETLEKIERRKAIGLADTIGNGPETWADRYYGELSNHRELKAAFQESLKLGVKVAPPDWFRNSIGYELSRDRPYFTE